MANYVNNPGWPQRPSSSSWLPLQMFIRCCPLALVLFCQAPVGMAEHWAFVPPARPPVPNIKLQNWARNPIDYFVLSRLEQENLRPATEADRTTLLRRVSLDLIGLPPTIQEVDAFLNDDDDGAYERQVARLLQSLHYGEQWARYWLDAARYADSDGFEKDKPREVWSYRDWVIRALNDDLPYDQFIIQQIAGDLLPEASQDHHLATGFLRNSMLNEEGGIDPEQFRMEAMFDRMDAIGKSILGLTIQCAQCHDHKYDPLAQLDYYRLFAFINNSHEANIAVYSPTDQLRRAEILARIDEIEDELKHQNPEWKERLAEWEETVSETQSNWQSVIPLEEDRTTGGQKYKLGPDDSLLAQGYAPTRFDATFRIHTNKQNITAFRLELLNDPNLPRGGPGRSLQGTGALTEFKVEAAPLSDPAQKKDIPIASAVADLSLPRRPLNAIYDDRSGKERVTGPIEFAVDDVAETAWGMDAGPGRRNRPHQAIFVAQAPVSFPDGTELTIHLNQNHGGWNSDDNQNHNLGRFRLSITTDESPRAEALPPPVEHVLTIPRQARTPDQIDTLFSYWRTTVSDWNDANQRIEAAWQEHPEPASQLALQERQMLRATNRLERGDFLQPQETVQPGIPDFLHPLPPDAKPDRLTFARWLADRDSPTTARAIVNRVWQAYFGTGLVGTSEGLGLRSELPSHPELLDWLSVQFMEDDWSLKRLHALIVTSATYRQSSSLPGPGSDTQSDDPYNRLLARGPRFRVDAEVVRDIALSASGLLNPKISGPSVYPPSPAFLYEPPVSYGPKVWKESSSESYRRALYTFRYRSVPYPPLQTFDAPNGDFSCVRRERSNTPLQALVTLNEPLFMKCAQALAWRVLQEGGATDDERLAYAFRRSLTRQPTDGESHILTDLLSRQLHQFVAEDADPWQLTASDPKNPPELPDGTTVDQWAAWTAVSRVLLNLDETITKQ